MGLSDIVPPFFVLGNYTEFQKNIQYAVVFSYNKLYSIEHKESSEADLENQPRCSAQPPEQELNNGKCTTQSPESLRGASPHEPGREGRPCGAQHITQPTRRSKPWY
jgi:hypothetical protein